MTYAGTWHTIEWFNGMVSFRRITSMQGIFTGLGIFPVCSVEATIRQKNERL